MPNIFIAVLHYFQISKKVYFKVIKFILKHISGYQIDNILSV